MQPIHKPTIELRQQIESDVDQFFKRGGKVKVLPLIQKNEKPAKNFSLKKKAKSK